MAKEPAPEIPVRFYGRMWAPNLYSNGCVALTGEIAA